MRAVAQGCVPGFRARDDRRAALARLAARYVSGYLLTQPPPGQPRLIGADASHAWVEVYDPAWPEDNGWLQLDPTNDRAPGDDYVMLSIGRDYGRDALRGVIRGGGADQELKVGVTVEPLDVV